MKVIWTPRNIEKVEAHGLNRTIVEAALGAVDFRSVEDPGTYRRIGEGTVEGRLVRVVFAESGPDEVYPITAYPVSRARRKT